MTDQALTIGGAGSGAAAPLTYQVPGAGEIILKGAYAHMDGTGAGAAWVPCLRVKTPNGQVMLECIGTSVVAGGSADVTWFPGVDLATGAGAGGNGFQFHSGSYGADNVGDWSLIETSGTAGQNFSRTSYVGFDITGDFGLGINASNGVIVTSDPTLTANPPLNVNQLNSTSTSAVGGISVDAENSHGGGAALAILSVAYSKDHQGTGVQSTAQTDTGTAFGAIIEGDAVNNGAGGTGAATGSKIVGTSYNGNATGALIQSGDPTGRTTAGTVSILQCQNIASGVAGTIFFEVVRPTVGNHNATVFCRSLPTSSVGLASGALWNNAGVVNVV